MHGAVDTTLIAAICVYLVKELVLPAVLKVRARWNGNPGHNPNGVTALLTEIRDDVRDLKDYVFQNLPRR